jgi:hypothetical protein
LNTCKFPGGTDGDRHRPLTIMRIPTVIAGNQGSMAHDAVWRSRRNRLFRLRDPSRGQTGSAVTTYYECKN